MEFYDYLLNSAATISGAIGFVLLILEVRKKDGKGINVSLAILAIALLLFYIVRYCTNSHQKVSAPTFSESTASVIESTGSISTAVEPSSESVPAGVSAYPMDTSADGVYVPDVVGMNVYEAEQLLTLAGLKTKLEDIQGGKELSMYVSHQFPEAGQVEQNGTVIKLWGEDAQTTSPKQTLHDFFLQKIDQCEDSKELLDAKDGNEIVFWSLGDTVVQNYNFNKVDDPMGEELDYIPLGMCFMDVSFYGIVTSDVQLTIGYRHSDGSESPRSVELRTENNAALIALPKGTYIFRAEANGHFWEKDIVIEQSGKITIQMEQLY